MNHRLSKNIEELQLSGIRTLGQEASQYSDVILLTIGEPMFNTASEIKDAAKIALDENQTKYPPYQGMIELRNAVVEFEKKTQNIDYTPEEVLITQGASGALFTALGAILNPKDEVIVFDPSYVAYYPTIATFKGVPVTIDTTPDGFQLSYEKIKSAITEKTKAIIINSPNNPTGTIYNHESLRILKQIMDEHNIYVITDDVYNQLIYEDANFLVQDQTYKSQILYCQSLSKPFAMTGWRIGYLLAEKEIIEQALKIQQFMAAGIPPFIQLASIQAFKIDVKPIVEQYKKNLDAAKSILDEHKIDYIEPKGAFYLFIDISRLGMKSWDFCRSLLKAEKVAVVPGAVFSAQSDSFVRISFCTDYEKLVKGLTRFSKYLVQ